MTTPAPRTARRLTGNDLGADPKLVVDGRYGPATAQAVKNFQAAVKIPVDGIAAP